jgi:hypothetical protein
LGWPDHPLEPQALLQQLWLLLLLLQPQGCLWCRLASVRQQQRLLLQLLQAKGS